MGRTGTFFAFQDYGVQPDIMTLAKALGSGVPVGAFLANEKVAAAIDYGDHGTTFGGNPLACAAALATIAVIEEEDLVENARVNGEKVLQRLQQAQSIEPSIVAVRGKGLMIGVELDFPGRAVVAKMMEKGVLGNCANENVMRLVPPLNMGLEDLYKVVEVLLEAIQEVKATQA
jgi:acetylornithine/N-succinyldiaminopimelate aminotransferase